MTIADEIRALRKVWCQHLIGHETPYRFWVGNVMALYMQATGCNVHDARAAVFAAYPPERAVDFYNERRTTRAGFDACVPPLIEVDVADLLVAHPEDENEILAAVSPDLHHRCRLWAAIRR